MSNRESNTGRTGQSASGSRFEDVSSYSSPKEYNKRKKAKRGRTVAKTVAGVLCGLLVVFGMGLMYVSTDLLGELSTTSITKDPEALGIKPEATMDDSITNIAMFGVDSRENTFTGLSDVIMVVSVDGKHNKIKMISIMRDSQVYLEDYGTIKVNSAYSYGGPELAIKALNSNYNLNITDYVTVNFTNMSKIVNAMGGSVYIEITAEERDAINENLWALYMEVQHAKESGTYDVNTEYPEIVPTIDILGDDQYGWVYLNGNQAVAYGRIRYIDSDYYRTGRQQKVFRALIDNVKNMGISDYPSMIKQMASMCDTSLELGEILPLTPIIAGDFTIETLTLPDPETTEFNEDPWYWFNDTDLDSKKIDAFIYEDDSIYYNDYYPNHGNQEGSSSEY